MNRRKAEFRVEDVVVSVICPHCQNQQHSPNYPTSFGWDKSDAKRVGPKGEMACEMCRQKFALPAALFSLMTGVN
ncbi:MAG: hypothetical protein ACRD9R_08920 [Pyrinomonadaceae bacterium]